MNSIGMGYSDDGNESGLNFYGYTDYFRSGRGSAVDNISRPNHKAFEPAMHKRKKSLQLYSTQVIKQTIQSRQERARSSYHRTSVSQVHNNPI